MREEKEDDLREVKQAAKEFCGKPRGEQPMQGSLMAMRQSGAGALRLKADEARRKADCLEALIRALPADLHALSPEADAALWELACPLKVRGGPRP